MLWLIGEQILFDVLEMRRYFCSKRLWINFCALWLWWKW